MIKEFIFVRNAQNETKKKLLKLCCNTIKYNSYRGSFIFLNNTKRLYSNNGFKSL